MPAAALMWPASTVPSIGLFYHYDRTARKGDLVETWVERRILHGLRRCHRVVVIAEFWRNYLVERGVNNPVIIHTPFDVAEVTDDRGSAQSLRRELCFDDRPLIYLGNAGAFKGAREAYDMLKGEGYQFFTTGARAIDRPVRNFNLPYREYLRLLSICDVVLAMSTFDEGWNRIAHEAMLLKRPVVGSGRGGLAELLKGGGQVICPEFQELPGCVERALAHREALGQSGRSFAERFTFGRFQDQWLALVGETLPVGRKRD